MLVLIRCLPQTNFAGKRLIVLCNDTEFKRTLTNIEQVDALGLMRMEQITQLAANLIYLERPVKCANTVVAHVENNKL